MWCVGGVRCVGGVQIGGGVLHGCIRWMFVATSERVNNGVDASTCASESSKASFLSGFPFNERAVRLESQVPFECSALRPGPSARGECLLFGVKVNGQVKAYGISVMANSQRWGFRYSVSWPHA